MTTGVRRRLGASLPGTVTPTIVVWVLSRYRMNLEFLSCHHENIPNFSACGLYASTGQLFLALKCAILTPFPPLHLSPPAFPHRVLYELKILEAVNLCLLDLSVYIETSAFSTIDYPAVSCLFVCWESASRTKPLSPMSLIYFIVNYVPSKRLLFDHSSILLIKPS